MPDCLSIRHGDVGTKNSRAWARLYKEVWVSGSMSTLSPDLQSYADNVLWMEDMSPTIDRHV